MSRGSGDPTPYAPSFAPAIIKANIVTTVRQMLDLGWFHRSATETVVEGYMRNSVGYALSEISSLDKWLGSWIAAVRMGCSSIFSWEVLADGGSVLKGVVVTVSRQHESGLLAPSMSNVIRGQEGISNVWERNIELHWFLRLSTLLIKRVIFGSRMWIQASLIEHATYEQTYKRWS